MMGAFCNTSFLTAIWSQKHSQRMYFHPPLLTWKYLENSWKFSFLKFWHFFKFYSFLRIFSLLKYVQKWLKQRLNKSMFKWIGSSKDDKVWTDYEKYFLESYLSYSLVNTCWLNSSKTKSYGIFSFEVRHWSYSLVCQGARSRPVSPNIVTHLKYITDRGVSVSHL